MTALPDPVFLDRDGVINRDKNYIHRVEDFEFIDGAVEALRQINALGRPIFVVTNQSGIGRGYYSEDDFRRVNAWMLQQLQQHGVRIAGVYYCPHAPEADCECRKPQPGMILQARREHQLELQDAWMAGDKTSDIEAARRAGVRQTVLVRSGKPIDPERAKPLYVCDSILDMIPLLRKGGEA